MNTYLLAWNPKRWTWDNLESMKQKLSQGTEVDRLWSCRSRKVEIGDRIFIIRLGEEPKGIFASGHVTEKTEGQHWDKSKNELIPYVRVKFDKLINPDKVGVKMLFMEELKSKEFQPMHWSTQMSGVQIRDDVADHLEEVWKQY
jgi:5-methylcytosine-specific restriction protein A